MRPLPAVLRPGRIDCDLGQCRRNIPTVRPLRGPNTVDMASRTLDIRPLRTAHVVRWGDEELQIDARLAACPLLAMLVLVFPTERPVERRRPWRRCLLADEDPERAWANLRRHLHLVWSSVFCERRILIRRRPTDGAVERPPRVALRRGRCLMRAVRRGDTATFESFPHEEFLAGGQRSVGHRGRSALSRHALVDSRPRRRRSVSRATGAIERAEGLATTCCARNRLMSERFGR